MTTYIVHYLQQSCGWMKVAECACATKQAAEATEQRIRANYPADELRFEYRTVNH